MKGKAMSKAKVEVKEKKVRTKKTAEIKVDCPCAEAVPAEKKAEGQPCHLYLMRHAKASKEHEHYDDSSRPLIKRGRKDAKMMRKLFSSMHLQPDLILCSPALRATETLEEVRKAFSDPEIRFVEELYLASTSDLFSIAKAIPAIKHEVLIIGHNPGMAEFAEVICDNAISDDRAYRRMGKKFPTAATAFIELTKDWKSLGDDTGRLIEFIRPADLK